MVRRIYKKIFSLITLFSIIISFVPIRVYSEEPNSNLFVNSLDGNIKVITGSVIYRIENKYKAGQYLYEDSNNQVAYGTPDIFDMRSHWVIEDAGNGKYRIRNRATGHYMNIEGQEYGSNPPLKCSEIQEDWASARFEIKLFEGDYDQGTYVVKSELNSNYVLHIEQDDGVAHVSNWAQETWGSAHWVFRDATNYDNSNLGSPEPPTGTQPPEIVPNQYYRIQNEWKQYEYLYDDNGIVKYGTPNSEDERFIWMIEEYNGNYRIKNKATGNYINIEGHKIVDKTYSNGYWADVVKCSQWQDKNTFLWQLKPQGNSYNIMTVADQNLYPNFGLHVEDQLGTLQCSDVNPTWGSMKWNFRTLDEPIVSKPVEKPDFSGSEYWLIKNYWTKLYLMEKEGKLIYGNINKNDESVQWAVEKQGEYYRLRNKKSGHYINIKNNMDYVEVSSVDPNDLSAQWNIEYGTKTGYVVIQNPSNPNQYINVEAKKGYAQCTQIDPSWGSPQWMFIPANVNQQYVRIKSVYNNGYMYEDKDGRVRFSPTVDVNNPVSHWLIEIFGNAKRIKNRATGHYLAVESLLNGNEMVDPLESMNIQDDWMSALWTINSVGDNVYSLQNVYRSECYIHVEENTDYVYCNNNVSSNSQKVQWTLEPVNCEIPFSIPTGYVRIKNNLTGSYLYENLNGVILYGNNPPNDGRAHWKIEIENGIAKIKNRVTGHYISIDNKTRYVEALPQEMIKEGANWIIEVSDATNYVLIKSNMPERETDYINIENQAGYVECSLVSNELGSAKWAFEEAPENFEVPNNESISKNTEQITPILNYINPRFEAEEAFYSGGACVSKDNEGYSGAGYVAGLDMQGSRIVFNVNVPSEGLYKVVIGYSNGTNSLKTLTLYANGIKEKKVSFSQTGSWTKWNSIVDNIFLRQGLNTIMLQYDEDDSGNVFIDYIEVPNCINNSSNGATINFTRYEAENAVTNGEIIEQDRTYRTIASEASGRRAVKLFQNGHYINFVLTKPANAIVIRYCIPDSSEGGGIEAPINLYINGEFSKSIILSSEHSWVYGVFPWSDDPKQGNPHRFFEEVRVILDNYMPAGTVITLKKDENCSAEYYYIDFIETEIVPKPYSMPENYISILDFGAIPNDNIDDTQALVNCIETAKSQHKGVWIPEGTFNFDSEKIALDNVVIRGAGMWYTVLKGKYATFLIVGDNVGIYDLSIEGEETTRIDSHPAAIESDYNATTIKNITIQNLWIEHSKVGIWINNGNNVYISGCRIRNTYADGINLTYGTKYSMIENTHIRYTGDDGIALWAQKDPNNPDDVTHNVEGNIVRFNTIEMPWLASNIGIYGGKNNIVSDNLLVDTIAFGGGINISSKIDYHPYPFEGFLYIERNRLIRCGGREWNFNQDFGAIWVNCAGMDINGEIIVRSNEILDSTYQGISINGSNSLNNFTFENNIINQTGTWGINILSTAKGSGIFRNNTILNTKINEFFNGSRYFTPLLTNDMVFPSWAEGGKLSVKEVTSNSVTLQFPAAVDNGLVTYYKLIWNDSMVTLKSTYKNFTIKNLTSGQEYLFKLYAIDNTGNLSPQPLTLLVRIPKEVGDSGNTVQTFYFEQKNNVANEEKENNVRFEGEKEEKIVEKEMVNLIEEAIKNKVQKISLDVEKYGFNNTLTLPENAFNLAKVENASTLIEVKYQNTSIEIPVNFIEDLKKNILKSMASNNLVLNIKITKPEQKIIDIVNKILKSSGLEAIEKPINFEIYLTSADKTINVDRIGLFTITKNIALEKQITKEKLSTVFIDVYNNLIIPTPSIFDISDNKMNVRIFGNTIGIFVVVKNNKSFNDINGHWAAKEIELLNNKLIVNGIRQNEFAPQRNITRAEFVTMLVRALGLWINSKDKIKFKDIDEKDWYTNSINTAVNLGLVNGFNDGTFRPNDYITREQMVAMIIRTLSVLNNKFKLINTQENLARFADSYYISPWAKQYVSTAIQLGLIKGKTFELLAPKDFATRAEAAVMLVRFLTIANLAN
ncbi:S-layer domain protein [Caldicellulosiruptor hydrothermalis 108]|uniref:S-layer domain protein n=1 Tax=Caldicellulosiruptor hydrothermalis (strain DSM 18901 / VKM B-2411 / 108) TaxID=632292 RepID=E4Q933_CALH1|nr:S-layer homology domain-containing protein [Caldicellulosiruptor hydrothermalis]ADQ08082.1 S-layer domain protein [Caldicellulosiruptor hydrothermalis 108]